MLSGNRQITEVGGLMSYGADIKDAHRGMSSRNHDGLIAGQSS